VQKSRIDAGDAAVGSNNKGSESAFQLPLSSRGQKQNESHGSE
jgi:hypothetical protein